MEKERERERKRNCRRSGSMEATALIEEGRRRRSRGVLEAKEVTGEEGKKEKEFGGEEEERKKASVGKEIGGGEEVEEQGGAEDEEGESGVGDERLWKVKRLIGKAEEECGGKIDGKGVAGDGGEGVSEGGEAEKPSGLRDLRVNAKEGVETKGFGDLQRKKEVGAASEEELEIVGELFVVGKAPKMKEEPSGRRWWWEMTWPTRKKKKTEQKRELWPKTEVPEAAER